MSLSDDNMGLLKVLGFVAWSDERIAPEEKEMLSAVMDSLDIPEERREELCGMLGGGPPPLEEISALFSDDTERRFAMAQAIMLAQADGEVAPAEHRDLQSLAGALGIDDDELEMIRAAVDVTYDLVPAQPATAE